MSSEDSFINEVTEEVRRDKLNAMLRRYGWIAVLAVLLLVGGAAWNEWRKARATAEAEALGNAILEALDANGESATVDALASIEADGPGAAIVALLTAGPTATEAERATSAERLDALASTPELDPAYRDLAMLKAAMLLASSLSPEERIARLEPLTLPGAPYRVLAEEQIALAEIDRGEITRAIEMLEAIGEDEEATQGLRRRASQLIVALGGGSEEG